MKSPVLLLLIVSPLAVFAWTGGVYDTEDACKSGCPGDCSRQSGTFDSCSVSQSK
ncbi:hypothetical protein CCHR01_01391 [Colletotrichum chrysophilum]|uniref:Uncharacterized protein n=1 Tax=Colletotrichum chrysophilum TaxID=1836956 RepID=A0AAD9B270_9PEZI|nr:hypothetical protein CCHR01_01391 [Colletotrichum chrysophilum]